MRLIDADLLKQNCKITGEFDNHFQCVDLITLGQVIDNQPTLDEKEIIRKEFERVVERLEEQKQQYKRRRTENAEKNIHHMAEINYAKACSYDYAIKIVKKECGISE